MIYIVKTIVLFRHTRLSSIIIVWYLGKENQSRPIIKGLPAPDVHYITI